MGDYQPDILAKGLSVLIWAVIHLVGFTDVRLEPHRGRRLRDYHCGLTLVVRRPTRRASEVSYQEYRNARSEFEARMRNLARRSLAFLGKRAYTAMTDNGDVQWGRQREPFAGIVAWIVPNPSGLNRGFTLAALVDAYTEVRIALES